MHAIIRSTTRFNFKTRSNANRQSCANLHTIRTTIFAQKLLVLDMNGTLIFRPPHRKGQSERPIFLRPFMRTFREYLFHDETCLWLDTMVWSSAQPHNVAAMAKSCFMEDRERLVQVWGRDRMALNRKSYCA